MPRPIHSPALLLWLLHCLLPACKLVGNTEQCRCKHHPLRHLKKGSWSPAHTAVCSTVSQHLQPLYYLHAFPQGGIIYTMGSCQREELIPQNCEGEGDCWNHLVEVMKGALLCPVVSLLLLGIHLMAFMSCCTTRHNRICRLAMTWRIFSLQIHGPQCRHSRLIFHLYAKSN